eukprot:scaffold71808_cov69-Phaeocystis_antarctica.AAC.2
MRWAGRQAGSQRAMFNLLGAQSGSHHSFLCPPWWPERSIGFTAKPTMPSSRRSASPLASTACGGSAQRPVIVSGAPAAARVAGAVHDSSTGKQVAQAGAVVSGQRSGGAGARVECGHRRGRRKGRRERQHSRAKLLTLVGHSSPSLISPTCSERPD